MREKRTMHGTMMKTLGLFALIAAFSGTQALADGYYNCKDDPECEPVELPDCYGIVDFVIDKDYVETDYYGTIFFDVSAVSQLGESVLKINSGLYAVSLEFDGQTYIQCDDIDYDDFPLLKFNHGELVGLNFAFEHEGYEYLVQYDEFKKKYNGDWEDKGDVTYGDVYSSCDTEVIPTPAAASGGLALLAAMGFRRRREAA